MIEIKSVEYYDNILESAKRIKLYADLVRVTAMSLIQEENKNYDLDYLKYIVLNYSSIMTSIDFLIDDLEEHKKVYCKLSS